MPVPYPSSVAPRQSEKSEGEPNDHQTQKKKMNRHISS